MKKRKQVLAIVTGMIMGIMLTGCGDQKSQSSATGQIPEEDQIEYFPEEVQDAIDNAEQEHEEMLEAEYPEGILPPGTYKMNDYRDLVGTEIKYITQFESSYTEGSGVGIVSHSVITTDFVHNHTDEETYVYDADTKTFRFTLIAEQPVGSEVYYPIYIFEGYLTDDGNFCMTYYEELSFGETVSKSEDIEWIYTRE